MFAFPRPKARLRLAIGAFTFGVASLPLLLALPSEVVVAELAGERAPCAAAMVVPVSVAFDEPWVETFGLQAPRRANDLLKAASRLFEPSCLRFQPVESIPWSPPGGARTVQELHHEATHRLQDVKGDYVLVLTAAPPHGNNDGFAAGRHGVVRHHPRSPKEDIVVIAHEFAHLLGLGHHQGACGCIMDSSGSSNQWSPIHQQQLRQLAQTGALPSAPGRNHETGSQMLPCY